MVEAARPDLEPVTSEVAGSSPVVPANSFRLHDSTSSSDSRNRPITKRLESGSIVDSCRLDVLGRGENSARRVVCPQGTNLGIISGNTMKTAISIDEGLLREADETARRMRLSRSRLFALALGHFLQQRRREQMLHQLNEVYAKSMSPAEQSVLKGIKSKVRRAVGERW